MTDRQTQFEEDGMNKPLTPVQRERALRDGRRRWLYMFDDLTGVALKVRRPS